MPFSVRIERIGVDGRPLGMAAVELVSSESEAIMVVRRAIKLSRKLTQPMQFSVYGPGDRLVLTCRSDEQAQGFDDAQQNPGVDHLNRHDRAPDA